MSVFGCAYFPFLRPYNHYYLEYRIGICIFLGYNSLNNGYLSLYPSRRVHINNHTIFNESCFPYESRVDFTSINASYASSCSQRFSSFSPTSSEFFSSPIIQLDISYSQSPTTIATATEASSTYLSPAYILESNISPIHFFYYLIPLPTALLYMLLYLIPLPMHSQLLHSFIILPL